MNWRDLAECRDTPPQWFFPQPQMGRGDAIDRSDPYENARPVCARCPVANDCLEWAIAHNEYGYWGGMSENERQALKRRRRYAERTGDGW